MIRVLLDTNILRAEGMNSVQMQRLQRLIENKVLKLIIPEIVIEEYKSQVLDLAQVEINKIKSSFSSLKRQNIDLDDIHELVLEERTFLEEAQHKVNKIPLKIERWIAENHIEIYKISNTSIEELFKCYFSGKGAFRDKKNRDDIPDAVIYDAIINLSKSDELLVVLNDKVLVNALKNIQKVKSFSSLKAFLELDTLKESILLIDKDDDRSNNILSLLETFECQNNIKDHILQKSNKILDASYYEDMIDLPFELSEIDDSSIEINPKPISKETYIHLMSPNYLGNNRFSLELSFRFEAKLSFYCNDEQFEEIPYTIRKRLSKNTGIDHKLHITGDIEAEFEGVVIIESKIKEELLQPELSLLFSDLNANQLKIKCSLQLDSIQINEY